MAERETEQVLVRRLNVQLLMGASYDATYERLFGTISQTYAAQIQSAGEATVIEWPEIDTDTTPDSEAEDIDEAWIADYHEQALRNEEDR